MDPITEKKSNNKAAVITIVLLGILLVLSVTVYLVRFCLGDRQAQQAVENQSGINMVVSEDKNSYKFSNREVLVSDVVDKISPNVVSVLTTVSAQTFWGNDSVQQGAGSGVILSKDGYVLTNKHVVNSASTVVVVLSNGETYENVKVIFLDPMNDLAFLKIGGVDNLSPIEIGDSKTIKVGQPVLAIGNALGEYQNTVTDGIISGMGRNIVAQSESSYGTVKSEGLTDLIQTNAAINSGNSGGALVNAGGQLIGINTAVAQNANGIGFAIPIGAAKGIIKQLGQNDSNVKRSYVGVSYIELNPTVSKQYKLDYTRGALVGPNNGVKSGSPAEVAGLKDGDVITKVNGFDVGVIGSVATLVAEFAPGETIDLTVQRGQSGKDIKVKIGEY